MEKLKVNGYMIEVDYPAELEPYMDRLDKVRVRGEKVQACSPFRNESHPSWAVNLDNGSWVDSGADKESDRKGSFITLLAHFRGESYEDAANYLLDKYTHLLDDTEGLQLNLNLQIEVPEVAVLGQEKYEDVVGKPSVYLLSRGISEQAQRQLETGIGKEGDAVAIPWHDVRGRIINIKYRSMLGKEFWFSSGGQPIKKHVYGLFLVKQYHIKEVWAVESEIDALYLWSLGYPAIAFGGGSINDRQKNLLLNSSIERLIIATDNDTVGHRFAEVLRNEFMGFYQCFRIAFTGQKDVNEMSKEQVEYAYKNKIEYGLAVKL